MKETESPKYEAPALQMTVDGCAVTVYFSSSAAHDLLEDVKKMLLSGAAKSALQV
jgi:hypothetical protein